MHKWPVAHLCSSLRLYTSIRDLFRKSLCVLNNAHKVRINCYQFSFYFIFGMFALYLLSATVRCIAISKSDNKKKKSIKRIFFSGVFILNSVIFFCSTLSTKINFLWDGLIAVPLDCIICPSLTLLHVCLDIHDNSNTIPF